jgi:hypothetical protein
MIGIPLPVKYYLVLCPSSTGRLRESAQIGDGGEGPAVQGMTFASQDVSTFADAFWAAALKDTEIRDAIASAPHVLECDEEPQLSAAKLAAAWTTATTEAAQHFGIEEDRLPCLLVMSLWEHTSLVVRLRPKLSIYELLRQTKIALGDRPARIAALAERQRALTKGLRAARKRDEATHRTCTARLRELDAAIGASEGLDPELQAHCLAALRRALDSGELADVPSVLAQLLAQTPRDQPLRHGAVWRLMGILKESSHVPVLEAELRQAEEDELAILRNTGITPDDKPARIAALYERRSAATQALSAARKRDEGIRRSRTAQIQQLDEAIEACEGLDTELRARCQAALRHTLDSGEPGDAPQALAMLHQQMPRAEDHPALQHSTVSGLKELLEAKPEAEELESDLRHAREDEKTIHENMQLSSAVISACNNAFDEPTIEVLNGQGALTRWTVRYIDQARTSVGEPEKVRR